MAFLSLKNKSAPALALAAGALVVALAGTGCNRRVSPVAEGDRTGTLHVGIGGEPSELDPHIINAPPDYRIAFAFFEGLTRPDPSTSEPRPGVAERWTVSPDGLVYTFHLRGDAKWSDGTPVTAADFVASFRRALSPALGSQYTLLFNPVRGAADYAAGKLAGFGAVGFAAPDPRTLVVTLAQPTPYFLALITGNPIWFPVPVAVIARHGPLDRRGAVWTRPDRFVGNGPFVPKEWRPNQRIVAEKSPTYWNASAVRLRAVHFYPIDNVDSEERAFRADQLHVTITVPVARIPTYRAERPAALRISPQLTVSWLVLNTARPALADPRVRRALALALERAVYAERILSGTDAPAFNIVPAGMPGYTPRTVIRENAAAARALLAEAGFPGGAGFPKLTISRQAGSAGDLVQAIQQAWRTQLGLDIAIVESESRMHWSTMQTKNYDIGVAGWNADYPDASTFLDLFTGASGWNFTNWADADYDRLIAASAGEIDPARRLELLRQAEHRLLEQMPAIPLTFARNRTLLQPSVRDWADNVLDRPDYVTVWLERK